MLRSIKGRLSISRSLVGRRLEKYGLEPLKPCLDRKSTRLNSSHRTISYAVFCLKKKIHSKFLLIDPFGLHHPNSHNLVADVLGTLVVLVGAVVDISHLHRPLLHPTAHLVTAQDQ